MEAEVGEDANKNSEGAEQEVLVLMWTQERVMAGRSKLALVS